MRCTTNKLFVLIIANYLLVVKTINIFVYVKFLPFANLFIKKAVSENAINKSNKGKSLVTLIFLSQSEVKKP